MRPSADTRLPVPIPATPVFYRQSTTLLWSAVPGRMYRVQIKASINDPWENLPGDVASAGTTAAKLHDGPRTAQSFYRVVLVQ